jgi:DNA repair protein RadD
MKENLYPIVYQNELWSFEDCDLVFRQYYLCKEAVDKIIDFVNGNSNKKGLFVYPTSFGKSLVVASVANKFTEKHFIVITASKELLRQNYEKYTSYGYEASLCSASLNSKEVSHVTFSTIGTIIKHIDYFKDKDVVILFDEAHIASKAGNQLDTFIKKIKKVKLLGLTATPFTLSGNFGTGGTELKMMNRDRKCIYNSIEDIVQISECTEQGYWSELVYDIRNLF